MPISECGDFCCFLGWGWYNWRLEKCYPFYGGTVMSGVERCCLLVVLVVVVGLVSVAEGGTIRHDRNDQAYVDLGGRNVFESVGFVDGDAGPFDYWGSATLIAPDVLLTAAHVVDIAVSLDIRIGGSTYSADMWTAHPLWDGSDPLALLAGYDIGLIHLSTPVSNVTPAPLYTGYGELNSVGVISGFGMTGTGLTGATIIDGERRAGFNSIDAMFGNPKKSRIMLSDFDNPLHGNDNNFGSAVPLELEYMVASGDSGGPMFIKDGSGLSVAGVNSFVVAPDFILDSDYGDVSGHTRVSAFGSWIKQTAGTFSAIEMYGVGGNMGLDGLPIQFSSDFAAIPEPGTVFLLGVGGLGLVRRRRG